MRALAAGGINQLYNNYAYACVAAVMKVPGAPRDTRPKECESLPANLQNTNQ